MKKINSMTKEQDALVPIYLNKWLESGYSTHPLDKNKTSESVKWLYEFKGMKTPYMWFCDSPMQIQLLINIFKDEKFKELLGKNIRVNLWANLRANLWANLRANLLANLRDNLLANLGGNLGVNLGANLWDNLGANLWGNLRDNLWANLRDNLLANLRDNLLANLGGNLGVNSLEFNYFFSPNTESYWVGFYDFILNELFPERRKEFKIFNNECLEFYKNIHLIIPFEKICFISERPTSIYKVKNNNDRFVLHNTEGPCLTYKDGYEFYALDGVRISKENHNLVREKKDAQSILKIPNADQRVVCIKYFGAENMLTPLGAKIISERDEYKLYQVKIEDSFEKLLSMKNPSEPKTHYEWVIPEINTVNEALAWRFNIPTHLYKDPIAKT